MRCDVICRRFKAFSGNAAVLDSALASAAKEIAAGREAPAAQALAGCRLGYPTIR
jgi:hypothetical protein